MPTLTRQRLIEAGIRRFYRDGFRNVGIDQILVDVGISKTAFYKHFECKEDLMLAALEAQNRWLHEKFHSTIAERGGPTPLGRLHAVMDVVKDIIEMDDFHGCIFVNAAMEFPLAHDPAHVAASRNKQEIEDIVCRLATEAGACDPRYLAQQMCLIMEGAYVTRQVTGSTRSIDTARALARMVIEAAVPNAVASGQGPVVSG